MTTNANETGYGPMLPADHDVREKLAEMVASVHRRIEAEHERHFQSLLELKQELDRMRPLLCRCCGEHVPVLGDADGRCRDCREKGMVRCRRGWRQLGVYDG